MQDIKPKEKRTIRNIVLPNSAKQEKSSGGVSRKQKRPFKKDGGNRKFFFGGIALLLVLLLIGALLTTFGSAKVTVVPKTATAIVDTEVVAAQSGSETPAEVLYQEISLEKTATKTVPATGERYVEEQAQGTITVYNNHSDSSQRLITRTRFESPDGKIYRIKESVVVPGQKTVNGKTEPGSIDVTVYADEPGEEYNIGLTDFTIPGFEGDPRFDTFYAKSKTSMSGGFKGNKKQVAEGVLDETNRELDATLRAELLTEIQAQIPSNLTILESLVTFNFEDLPQTPSGDTVTLERKATITAPLFDKENLAGYLAAKSGIPNDIPLVLDSYTTLTISYVEAENTEEIDPSTIQFTVSGNPTFVGVLDESEIKQALVGKSKSNLSNILSSFPTIASAKATISPFWISNFPETEEEITVVIENTN